MTPEQQESILSIALLAAFADGVKADAEREEIRRLSENLATDTHRPDLARLYQNVLLKRVRLETVVTRLSDTDHRHLAYEMAVCVCDADGQQTDAEKQFLATLRQQLGLTPLQAQELEATANTLAEAVDRPLGRGLTPPESPSSAVRSAIDTPQGLAPDNAELDRSILRYALLNGALELLPQSWASMAIIPMQIKMVYGIGQAHGVSLDQGHVREFIAAAGVGLTSQYLEQFGRKLLGGLLGKIGGAATGMAFSFATTYALGQLAKRYYASGRVMNTELLRTTYQDLLEPAKRMQSEYLPQIKQKAATLDAAQIMAMVRNP